ncbi:hypothetical protein [Microbacterium stercoris]|uniref:Uncharacterized protein n=1 Tax=Microbacterium stercoris TaxID=2820289 RepID=A0A939TR26_9MICO|nr:hypothetical protein [Microbacterium stercoris]MBO3663706.1 hypothetical protein [Microbacterium stercoris]
MPAVDEKTGEVQELALVPLDIARLNEDEIAAMFPSPVQVAGALLIARERISRAPKALEDLAADVKKAKRDLMIARGKAFVNARKAGFSIADARAYAVIDDDAMSAQEEVDDAEIRLEYGRDLRRTLTTEIDILRSLNANFRAEHS